MSEGTSTVRSRPFMWSVILAIGPPRQRVKGTSQVYVHTCTWSNLEPATWSLGRVTRVATRAAFIR